MLVNVCGPLPAINMARKHTMGCKKRVNICEKQQQQQQNITKPD